MDPADTNNVPADTERATDASCEVCGDSVETTEWHPAATQSDDEGNIQILTFCDEQCRDHWLDED
ncbi:DUF7576 family protein [Haloarchaeobius sp. DFWS5]|uniref:DUF7576 family protein n=1 Tax=Haloarchaeobius sp. DFWS5 TaxID=3446114 RepID=UPI003EBF753C